MKWTARSPIANAFQPPKRRIFPLISVTTNRAAVLSHGRFANTKRPPSVDCDMVDFWTRIDGPIWSSHRDSARVSNPPRRPNFAQNMHPIKRCRRSIARPNCTTAEYPDVDHGFAVGLSWRFCFITPIAFVGGIDG